MPTLNVTQCSKCFFMGWLAVLIAFAAWFAVHDCVCEIGRLATYSFFAGWLSINFAVTALVVGVPCVLLLMHRFAAHSPIVWSAVGASVFAVPNFVFGALFQHDHGLDDAMFLGVLVGIGGGVTVYFARRHAAATTGFA